KSLLFKTFFLLFQPCTQDEECCGEQLCVWGQCSQNATKGEAGSTCQHQTDCSLDLCCAFHKALLFPICLAKPIERERCFGAPNNLMELLSWDVQDEGPSKHCPCVGDLHCQHLGLLCALSQTFANSRFSRGISLISLSCKQNRKIRHKWPLGDTE
uniref:Uncharacterized protein n=1 Tax=Mola mola TaxID=94237 RepID=A0A3Q3X9U4_MOLML